MLELTVFITLVTLVQLSWNAGMQEGGNMQKQSKTAKSRAEDGGERPMGCRQAWGDQSNVWTSENKERQ